MNKEFGNVVLTFWSSINFIKPSKQKSQFSVNLAIEDILCIIEHTMKYNYIDIKTHYANSNNMIFGYPNEFKQSILNIINNAKDSILKKRELESFEGKISIHVKSSKESICIGIKDNGTGIEDANLGTIFNPFVSTKEGGDGFGLYMAKLIIEDKMQGNIKAIQSEIGAHILICIKNKGNKESKLSS